MTSSPSTEDFKKGERVQIAWFRAKPHDGVFVGYDPIDPGVIQVKLDLDVPYDTFFYSTDAVRLTDIYREKDREYDLLPIG